MDINKKRAQIYLLISRRTSKRIALGSSCLALSLWEEIVSQLVDRPKGLEALLGAKAAGRSRTTGFLALGTDHLGLIIALGIAALLDLGFLGSRLNCGGVIVG